jgi:hypothetical protein
MTFTNIESVAAIEVMGGAGKGGKVQFGNRNAMIITKSAGIFALKPRSDWEWDISRISPVLGLATC